MASRWSSPAQTTARSTTRSGPLRGRLASIELLSFSGGPLLGNFESGVVASIFSVRVSVVSGGVLCVIGCVLAAIALPAFRNYDARVWKTSGLKA